MNLDDLLPEIMPECPDLIESQAIIALRHAIREFCEKSRAWRAGLDPIDLLEGFMEYDIDTPVGAEVVMVMSGTYDDGPVPTRTVQQMDALYPGWKSATWTGLVAIVPTRSAVTVYPIPSADDSKPLYLRAALKPTHAATSCGDVLDNWREGLVSGALARLKAMPRKAWTDREGVAAYRKVFDDAIGEAIHAALRGDSAVSLTVEPRTFGL